MPLYLQIYSPLLVSLALAAAVVALRRPKRVGLARPLRIATAITAGALIAVLVFLQLPFPPMWFVALLSNGDPLLYWLTRTLAPLALTTLALLALTCLRTPQSSVVSSGAPLTPRTWTTFVRPVLLWLFGAAVVLVLLTSIASGLTSSPDELGRYATYRQSFASETGSATTTYGWWFFARNGAALALLCLVLAGALQQIARPPLADDARYDTAVRSQRSTDLCLLAIGGVLLHLSAVLDLLSAAASSTMSINTSEAGLLTLGSSFAAFAPFLSFASLICAIAGGVSWFSVMLAALIPASARVPQRAAV